MNARSLRVGLLLVVLAATALRLWHIAADLPGFLEEAIPFRSALGLWSWKGDPTDWNPHFFNYPSLTLYLHFFLQKSGWIVAHAAGLARTPADWFLFYLSEPSGLVIPARIAHVAFDALAVGLTGLVAERLRRGAGVPAALLAALSVTLLTTARSISTDTVMGALALGALERMLAWREHGGTRRLVAVVVLIGLATGAKYPAALVLVPLAWILWSRDRGRGLALWPWCAVGALGVFLVTTPYALLDFTAFRRDFDYESLHVASGHFGQATGVGLPFHIRNLLRDLGPAGLGLLGASVALMIPRATRTIAVAVWLYLVVFLGPIAGARFGAERYLVPVIPVAAALAASAALELASRAAQRWRVALTALLLAGLLIPPFVSGTRAAARGGRLTQVEARRWLEAHLTVRDLVVEEAWGPGLPSVSARVLVQTSPIFTAAGPEAQRRYLKRPWFHAVPLPLFVAGRVSSRVLPPGRGAVDVEVFPAAVDLNGVAYHGSLFGGVDVVVTSSSVRGRFTADSVRHAAVCRFYRVLDSTATVVARITPHDQLGGPEIVVYRLGPRAHAALAASGPRDPLWWVAGVPAEYRRRATGVLGSRWEGGAPWSAPGQPAPWVGSLAGVYDERLRPFVEAMVVNLVDLGRLDEAEWFAEATLLALPDDPVAQMARGFCLRHRAVPAPSAPPKSAP